MSTATLVAQRDDLLRSFGDVRRTTMALCEPLAPEDMVVQTMPDVSPAKWHLAHVTWFFETFVLAACEPAYATFDPRYHELFNSYYQSLGEPYPRPLRGLLSRPTTAQVLAYRDHVDRAMAELLTRAPDELVERIAPTLRVGLHHEQQHQELLLMDLKNVFGANPLYPAYMRSERRVEGREVPLQWRAFEGGEVRIGAEDTGFAFDNERPQHLVRLEPYELASRPATAGEYREFMDDGGYERAELWLADGWDLARREGWRAPLYWVAEGRDWRVMTLGGLREVDPAEPVCHVSYYEADAFATWAESRLPSEFEWEHAARGQALAGNFLDPAVLHPRPAADLPDEGPLRQLFGDVWEWTASSYAPYPGYRPFGGQLGEYNGKFMVNQMVLRGGCCATPQDHLRRTYRNFYYPHQRWMFSGIRLARYR